MTKNFTLFIFFVFGCLNVQSQLTVQAFDEGLHQAANTIVETYSFPDDVSIYSEVYMHFGLTCPSGGCDPWDRVAWIKIEEDEQAYEICRYVTPYGNGDCSWSLDVTEYKEKLTGEVTLSSFIETWSNGWEISVEFEFIEGTPEYEFVDISNLWVDYQFTYGDTVFWSNNLDEQSRFVYDESELVVMRIVNTGHGQGNTQNAAEFSQMTHEIEVNGEVQYTQFLWKSDCGSNVCSPQGGTWTLSRAGWCPGQEVQPDDYDLTEYVNSGEMNSFDYVLESFFNECSPWNVDPLTGISNCDPNECLSETGFNDECDYNGNTHTQPNYKMSVQLIQYSNQEFPVVSVNEMSEEASTLIVYPNPANNQISIKSDRLPQGVGVLQIHDNLGRMVHDEVWNTYYTARKEVDTSSLANGMYVVSFNIDGLPITKVISIQRN